MLRFAQPVSLFFIAGAILIGAPLVGCAKKSAVNPIFAQDALAGGRSGNAWNDGQGARDAQPWTSSDGLGIQRTRAPYDPVYFHFDSYALSEDALAALRQYAPQMQSSSMRLMVEGHCDERGTEEYNLSLGEHRAQAVKQHLVRLGVDPQTLTTISYGEELPADPGQNETAWARNRRVEFSEY